MSKIVHLKDRIEYYRRKNRNPPKGPVSREEFDALVEELETYAEEIVATQKLLNRVVRILHASVKTSPS
jgi:hypothetical protein